MNNFYVIVLVFLVISCNREGKVNAERTVKLIETKTNSNIDSNIKNLIDNYPQIEKIENNLILFKDGSKMIYNDGKNKSFNELIAKPDVEDQFFYKYSDTKNNSSPPNKNNDPGRIRNEEFFKKIYGNSKKEVSENLIEMKWCPKLVGQMIKITKINRVNEKLFLVSKELDEHPEFKKYISNIGGTFNWRKINGTNRQSMHSFGMTIDINTNFASYWQWACGSLDENKDLNYLNSIPLEIVQIFEKYGFIWGGRWYHFDTMHFEYRPELLVN
jgi:hypothetical protein